MKAPNKHSNNGVFIAVIIRNLTHVTRCLVRTVLVSILFFLLVGLSKLGCIDSGGWSGAFLTSLVLLVILATVFLVFLPSLSRALGVVRAGRSCRNC